MKILQILVSRPIPIAWSFALSYLLLAPAALLIPHDVFSSAPWARDFTEAVAGWVPMVDRVVGYRHPSPDKLRCFLAYVWASMPLLVWATWRQADKYTLAALKTAPWQAAFALVLSLVMIAAIWSWPEFSLSAPMGELGSSSDARRKLFRTDVALAIATPLWAAGLAACIETIRSVALVPLRKAVDKR